MAKAKELKSFPGESDYELARALWMVEQTATGKSFDRLTVQRKNAKIDYATKIIEALDKESMVVTHVSDLDGG